ncbi:MAG: Hsp20/alpha crystallin family protein [bacterium]
MTETKEQSRTPRLLMMAVILLCIVMLLQLGLFLQRHLNKSSEANRLQASSPGWSQTDEIESMHAHINRLFDQAFCAPFPSQPPVAESNPPFDGGSAVPYDDSFLQMRRMQRQIDALFTHALNDAETFNTGFDEGWARLQITPGFRIQDDEDAYVISVSLPGVEKSGIHIGLNGSVLTLVAEQASRQTETNVTNISLQTRLTNCRFERRLLLPGATTNPGKIQASFTNGLLRVLVPKNDSSTPSEQPINIH